MGYSIRYALFQNSRGIDPQKAGGRSSWTSAYRAAARDPAAIGIGNAPLMELLNASRRDLGGQCRYKISGGTVTRSLQGYGFLFTQRFKRQANLNQVLVQQVSSIKRQASSPELQASSDKPQATSSVILDPRNMDIGEVLGGKGPRAFTMINVFLG